MKSGDVDLTDAEAVAHAVDQMAPDALDKIYAHVVKVTELFLEWRHKVMAFTFTVTSGLLALSAWMYDNDLKRAIAAPLFLGSLLALASALFDSRNQRILAGCYEIADTIETKLGLPAFLGPLGRIPVRRSEAGLPRLDTYHGVLWWAYRVLSGLLFTAAIYVLVSGPSPPGH